jgi:hypothetical protein
MILRIFKKIASVNNGSLRYLKENDRILLWNTSSWVKGTDIDFCLNTFKHGTSGTIKTLHPSPGKAITVGIK